MTETMAAQNEKSSPVKPRPITRSIIFPSIIGRYSEQATLRTNVTKISKSRQISLLQYSRRLNSRRAVLL